jgi:hypothetical protein
MVSLLSCPGAPQLSWDIPAYEAFHMISLPKMEDGKTGRSHRDRASSKSSRKVFACVIHAIGNFLAHLEVNYAA